MRSYAKFRKNKTLAKISEFTVCDRYEHFINWSMFQNVGPYQIPRMVQSVHQMARQKDNKRSMYVMTGTSYQEILIVFARMTPLGQDLLLTV